MYFIDFTGDRTTDRIMNVWARWYEKKYNCDGRFDELENKELDKLMYEVGMDDFVEFVLQEFPQMENVGYEYDPSSTWNMFLRDHKYGYDVEEALGEFMSAYIIDNDYVAEYIDHGVIAESYYPNDLNNFFTKDPIGKKMYVADRKAMVEAFDEYQGKFSNGFTFSIDEYVDVVMSVGDEENHSEADIRNYMKTMQSNPRYWVSELFLNNSRLYNGNEVHCVIKVDLERIGKNAPVKKTRGKSKISDDIY